MLSASRCIASVAWCGRAHLHRVHNGGRILASPLQVALHGLQRTTVHIIGIHPRYALHLSHVQGKFPFREAELCLRYISQVCPQAE